MKIVLKLYAMLADHLPAGASNNCVSLDVAEGTTPVQVLERCGVPEARVHLVLVNGVYLEPEQRERTVLQDGDELAVWPPIAGG